MPSSRYKTVVMGLSAGGMQALTVIVPALPASFPMPIVIAQHNSEHSNGFLAEYLGSIAQLSIKEAEDKEAISSGFVYLAPPGYHLLIEQNMTFSLSVDPRVNYSCPSIDVLFESAADACAETLIGVVMTGANADGSQGLRAIKARSGCAIVQNPETAEAPYMPRMAMNTAPADYVVDLEDIVPLLMRLGTGKEEAA